MVVVIISCVVALLLFCGYLLFTQQLCRIHHTLPLSQDTSSLPERTIQLAYWSSWLPWELYDEEVSVTVNDMGTNAHQGQVILHSRRIGKVECTLQQEVTDDSVSFRVIARRFFFGDLNISIKIESSDNANYLVLTGENKLPFWRRYHHTQQLNQLYADLKLMLVRFHAQLEPETETTLSFKVSCCQQLDNVDAVTRPFIVSDQPMSQTMELGFQDLTTALGPDNPPAGPRFAIFETADPSHHHFVGKLGVPIQCFTPCDAHPERIVLRGAFASLKFQGSYRYLGLAWHVLNMYCYCHNLRKVRRRPSIEVYEVSPHDTHEELQFITVLHAPIH